MIIAVVAQNNSHLLGGKLVIYSWTGWNNATYLLQWTSSLFFTSFHTLLCATTGLKKNESSPFPKNLKSANFWLNGKWRDKTRFSIVLESLHKRDTFVLHLYLSASNEFIAMKKIFAMKIHCNEKHAMKTMKSFQLQSRFSNKNFRFFLNI